MADAICFVLLGSVVPCLLGIAFLLQHRVGGFIHIGLGGLVVLGAFVFSWLVGDVGVGLVIAVVLCVAIGACAALGIEIAVFRKLRHARADAARLLLVSFAIYLLLENLVDLMAGGVTAYVRLGNPTESALRLGSLTGLQWVEIAAALLLGTVISVVVRHTGMGRIFRALADNSSLAELSGINSQRISAATSIVVGALCAVGGVALTLDTGVAPSAGLNLVIAGAVAAILGGLRDVSGVFAGALAVSVLQQGTVWLLGPQWMTLATYVVLFAALSWRRGVVFSARRGGSSLQDG